MNKNEFEIYEIGSKQYKFKDAPVYEQQPLISFEEVKKQIKAGKMKSESKLLKFDILGNFYADIYNKFFIIKISNDYVVFLNRHAFDDNLACCNYYIFCEKIYALDSNLNLIIEHTNTLYDYTGNIVATDIKPSMINALAITREGSKQV